MHNGNGSVELHVLRPYDVCFFPPDLPQILATLLRLSKFIWKGLNITYKRWRTLH